MISHTMTKRWMLSHMGYKVIPIATALLVLLTSGKAMAQMSFAVEGRASVTVPTGDLSDAGAEVGLGVGAELFVNFHPRMSVYAGVHQYSFGCEDGCTLGENPKSMGLAAGLKYFLHNPGDVLVWGRGGVIAHTFDNDQTSGEREIGFELGFGADMPIASQVYLVPHVGYVSHKAGSDFNASFLTLGVGAHYHF